MTDRELRHRFAHQLYSQEAEPELLRQPRVSALQFPREFVLRLQMQISAQFHALRPAGSDGRACCHRPQLLGDVHPCKASKKSGARIDMQAWHAHLFVWIWWLAGSKRKNPCLNFFEKAKQIQGILDHS